MVDVWRVLVEREKLLINIYSEHIYIYIYIYIYLMLPDISANVKYHNYDTAIKRHGITNYSYKGYIRQ